MFLKLFKYDFLSVFKKLVFYYIVLFSSAIIAKILYYLFVNTKWQLAIQLPTEIFFLAVGFGNVATVILCMIRYYKNMLSDEGYLTHTLPVKKSSILLSKLLVTLVSELITILAIMVSLLIYSPDIYVEIVKAVSQLFVNIEIKELIEVIYVMILFGIIVVLLGIFEVTLVAMCLSLVSTFNKSKVTKAILIYIGISMGLSIFVSFFVTSIIINIVAPGIEYGMGVVYLGLWIFIFVEIIGIIATYIINLQMLKNKLNLE